MYHNIQYDGNLKSKGSKVNRQNNYGMTDTMGRMHSDAQFAGS